MYISINDYFHFVRTQSTFCFICMKFSLNTLKKRFEMLVVSNNLLPLPLIY